MVTLLLKFLQSHPDQSITVMQSILDILKADPALMSEVIAFIGGTAK